MGFLGDWMARVLIDVSQVGPALSGSEKDWKNYYKSIEQYDEKTTEALKRSIKDITGVQVRTREETKAQISQLNKAELLMVQQHAKDLLRADKQRMEEIRKQAQMVSDLKKQIATFASVAITIPIYLGTKAALKDFVDFTQQMQNIKAVIGATIDEMRLLTYAAMDLGKRMSKSPTDIAKAMFELGQAGLDATEIYNEIAPVMQLSAAGMKDLSFTAELVVTTLKAFGLESDQASRVADIFSSSNAKSVSSLDKLNASLKYTAGLWSGMGWTLEDLVGTLDTLYDTGVRGEKAGRLLASAMNGLLKPTKSARSAISDLLGSSDALSPRFNTITDMIGKMAKAHATTTDVVKIFGKESAEVINRLVQNYDKLGGNIEEISGQMGETARQAAVQLDTMGKSFDRLDITAKNISKSFVSTLEPAIRTIANGLTSMLSGVKSLPDWAKALISSLLGVLAVAGPLALGLQKITKAMVLAKEAALLTGASMTFISLPMAAVVATVVALSTAFILVKKSQSDFISSIVSGSEKLAKSGKDLDGLISKLNSIADDSTNFAGKSRLIHDSLEELALVFPALRDQLNKNSSDTASAMSVLNSEYERYLRLKSKMSTVSVATDKTQLEMEELTKTINNARSSLVTLWTATNYDDIKKPLQSVHKEFSNIDTAITFAASGLLKLEEANTLAVGSMNPAKVKVYIDSFNRLSSELKSAENMLAFLKRQAATPAEIKIDTSQVPKLANDLAAAIDDLNNKNEQLKIQFALDDMKIDADDSLKELGKYIHGLLPTMFSESAIDLKKLGILGAPGELGEFAVSELDNMKLVISDAMKASPDWFSILFNSVIGGPEKITAFKGTLKAAQDMSDKLAAMKIDMEGLSGDDLVMAQEKYTDFANAVTGSFVSIDKNGNRVLSEQGQQLRTISLFLTAINSQYASIYDNAGPSLDWWGKIKKDIQDSTNLLQGMASEGISSLSQKLSELESSSGESYDNIMALANELQNALASNPETSGLAQFATADRLVEQLIAKLKSMALAAADAFGIPVPVEKFKEMLLASYETVKKLEEQRNLLDEQSFGYAVLTGEIEKAKKANADMLSSISSISEFGRAAKDAAENIAKDTEKTKELRDALASFADLNFDERMYVIQSIDPGDTIGEGVAALEKLIKTHKETEEEMKGAIDIPADASGKEVFLANEKLAKLRDLLDAIKSRERVSIKVVTDGVVAGVNAISSVISGIADASKAMAEFKRHNDPTALAQSLGSALAAIGSGIAAIPGGELVGGIMEALGALPAIVGSINTALETIDIGKILDAQKIEMAVSQAGIDAAAALQDDFENVGTTLGSAIMDGVKNGTVTSADDVSQKLRGALYDMMSQQLMTLSGFKEKIADIAARMWEKIAPGSAAKSNMKSKIEALETQMAGIGDKQLLEGMIKKLKETPILSSSEQDKQRNAAVQQMQIQIDMIDAYSAKINELQGQYDTLGETEVSADIQSSAIDEASTSINSLIEQLSGLKTALGVSAEDTEAFFSDLSNTFSKSLTTAVLTGSYVDFKRAIYDKIVTSIVEAMAQTTVVKSKIQAILNTIFDENGNLKMDAQGNIDAVAIIDQIKSAWVDATSTTSPLGQVFSALRESLSQFGLLNVNVSPANVVTAIPSDVRDDLIAAIKGTMDSLASAIASAGLNSSIGIVNITTAYITAMQSSQVLITQANLTLAGDMVFQMSTGQPLDSWLEDWMTKYLSRSAP